MSFLADLVRNLQLNSTGEVISLDGRGIGPAGAKSIASALVHNTSLKSLDLRRNGVGDEGATALAAALKVNHALRRLNLEDNDIGAVGATSIAQALGSNPMVSSINLRGNNIGNSGSRAILQATNNNRAIRVDMDEIFDHERYDAFSNPRYDDPNRSSRYGSDIPPAATGVSSPAYGRFNPPSDRYGDAPGASRGKYDPEDEDPFHRRSRMDDRFDDNFGRGGPGVGNSRYDDLGGNSSGRDFNRLSDDVGRGRYDSASGRDRFPDDRDRDRFDDNRYPRDSFNNRSIPNRRFDDLHIDDHLGPDLDHRGPGGSPLDWRGSSAPADLLRRSIGNDQDPSQKSCGVGIVFKRSRNSSYFEVEKVYEGGPAKLNGQIFVGDVLLAINGVNLENASASALTNLIVGPEGSLVDMTFEIQDGTRGGTAVKTVTLKRGRVPLGLQDSPGRSPESNFNNRDSSFTDEWGNRFPLSEHDDYYSGHGIGDDPGYDDDFADGEDDYYGPNAGYHDQSYDEDDIRPPPGSMAPFAQPGITPFGRGGPPPQQGPMGRGRGREIAPGMGRGRLPPPQSQRPSDGRPCGVGITFKRHDGRDYFTVKAIQPGGPAQRQHGSGIQVGDRLFNVDERPVRGMTYDELSSAILGPEGSQVALTMRREGFPNPKRLSIVRGKADNSTAPAGRGRGRGMGGPQQLPPNQQTRLGFARGGGGFPPGGRGGMGMMDPNMMMNPHQQEGTLFRSRQPPPQAGIIPGTIIAPRGPLQQQQQQRVGVGIAVKQNPQGQYFISKVLPGSPADQSRQLTVGDVVMDINGTPLQRVSMDDIRELILGPPGSTMQLTVIDQMTGRPRRASILRGGGGPGQQQMIPSTIIQPPNAMNMMPQQMMGRGMIPQGRGIGSTLIRPPIYNQRMTQPLPPPPAAMYDMHDGPYTWDV